MIHYPTLKREVLVAIRGKLSRSHCSQKMGFTFNKVQRWESTSTEIDWLEFVELSRVCRKDFPASFKKHLGITEDLKNYSSLLKKIIPEKDINLISKQMKIPRASIKAWLQGRRAPKLIYILQILHEYQQILVDIIEDTLEIEKIPSLSNEIMRQKKLREFHYQYPFTAGIFALIHTDYFDHNRYQEGIFSQLFGITLAEEKAWIQKALELGLIVNTETRFKLTGLNTVDTQGDYVAHIHIKEFWIQHTLKRLKELSTPDPYDRFGYLVFSGTPELMLQIHQEYYSFFQKLKTLIQASETNGKPAHSIGTINVQLILQSVNQVAKKA